jgi:hypothetical protein
MAQAFDALSGQPLLPLPQMAHDPVRAQVDAAVAHALGLPDLTPLREQLAREPVICLHAPASEARVELVGATLCGCPQRQGSHGGLPLHAVL